MFDEMCDCCQPLCACCKTPLQCAISTEIDQIWNAFVLILLTRIWTGSALLSTGFHPMGHQPAVPDQSPVQGCTNTIQCTEVSNSLALNIVNHVNQIRREDAAHARGA